MKSFNKFLSEISHQARSPEEQRFKDTHQVQKIDHPAAEESQFTGEIKGNPSVKNRGDQKGEKANDSYDPQHQGQADDSSFLESAEEADEDQLHELSKDSLSKYAVKATAAKAASKMQLDKKKKSSDLAHQGKRPTSVPGKKGVTLDKSLQYDKTIRKSQKTLAKREKGLQRAGERLLRKEEVETLDELKARTIGSYIRKATDNLARQKSSLASVEKRNADSMEYRGKVGAGMKSMEKIHRDNIKKREKGLDRADKALAKKEEFETLDELDTQVMIEGLELALDEVTQAASRRAVNVTGPDGKTRTVYKKSRAVSHDEYGNEKIKTEESVEETGEIIEENFKQGILKLKDRSSVILKKEDADILNKLFKDISKAGSKKMSETVMKNKKGFQEILNFAKEAEK